ncbi:hypothetical protein JCM3765_002105 [Sporobolomyces pararoseus]
MEWEELVPTSQQVLDAVRNLRDGDGLVDMEIDLPWELNGAKSTGDGVVVVVDTNILISHLPLLRSFVELCTSLPPAQRPTLLVPHIVLRELDGLKTSGKQTDIPVHSSASHLKPNRMTASISTLARAATNWLLSVVPSSSSTSMPSIVRGQRKSETLLSQHALRGGGGENNDSLVLDAAAYFVVNHSKRVVLVSDDNNLRLRAKFEQVETLTIDNKIGNDPRKLLKCLDPSVVTASTSKGKSRSLPPVSTTNGYHPSPRSPEPAPLVQSPKPAPKPIPLPSTLARSSSMELESSSNVPLVPSPHPPTLLPPKTPSSIFTNLLILFSHFIALPLYKTIYTHFKCLPDGLNDDQRRVLEDLGDWREWDAARCAEVLKRWWEEGGLRDLCEKGYEKLHPTTPVSSTPASPPPTSKPVPSSPPKREPPVSPRRQSRWAPTPASPPSRSRSAPLPTPVSPPRNPFSSVASRPVLPASVALTTLHSSLPSLIATFTLSPSSTSTWSSIRFEVLLENIGNWLMILLSGILNGNVKTEVERLVRNWEGELRGIGVKVDTIKLGMY